MATAPESVEQKPSGTGAHDVFIALMRTADCVRKRAARVVEPLGITLQQYNVLRILEGAQRDGLPTLEVAARMVEEAPGVTRLLDRLEAKAYIRRQRCPHDRRQHLCWLTSDGARLLARLTPAIVATHERTLNRLDKHQRRQLVALLSGVASSEA